VAATSRTDLVNSGSYFTELLVVVLGITIFECFGGSFFITGFTLTLIDTNDLGSTTPGFRGFGAGASGLATALGATGGAGFATGFTTALGTGFLATTAF
jgi:hypothetical protein